MGKWSGLVTSLCRKWMEFDNLFWQFLLLDFCIFSWSFWWCAKGFNDIPRDKRDECRHKPATAQPPAAPPKTLQPATT